MKRWMYVCRTVDRPVEDLWKKFRDQGREAFQDEGEHLLHADGSFATRVKVEGYPAPALRLDIGVSAEMPDGRIVVPLRWEAETSDLAFPHFDGAVELEPLSSRVSRLSIVGSYVPPLGPIGAVFDMALLHRAADRTAEALLDRLESRLLRGEVPTAAGQVNPAGAAMTVRDVMTKDPFVVGAELPLKTTALLLFHLDISGAPVVGGDGELVGVITERDLLDKEASQPYGPVAWEKATWRRRDAATAGDACSSPPRTTAPDVALRDAVAEMQRHGVGRLVVVDHADIVGIVTRHDMLAALIRNDAEILHLATMKLEHLGETEVNVRVDWGTVGLRGAAKLRSGRGRVIEAMTNIDGVLGVDADDLTWQTDDVTVLSMHPVA